MTEGDAHPEKETVFIYNLSPEAERELIRRARRNNRDASTEVTAIIEKHLEEKGNGDI